MIAVDNQPRLTDLHQFIKQVPSYPISVHRLLAMARRRKAPSQVLNFYSAFPDDSVFTDKEDIEARTEQVELLKRENPPAEDMRAEED